MQGNDGEEARKFSSIEEQKLGNFVVVDAET